MGNNGRRRWFSLHKSSASSSSRRNRHQEQQTQQRETPREFICPISGSLMFDPVVVPPGQTFERLSVRVCSDLGFVPELPDGSRPDFSAVISNHNMKSTIENWCRESGLDPPKEPDYAAVERIVRSMMPADPGIRVSEHELLKAVADKPPVMEYHADTEVMHHRRDRQLHSPSSSEESVVVVSPGPVTPLPLATRPACYSSTPSPSTSSSEIVVETEALTLNPSSSYTSSSASSAPTSPEEEEIYNKLRSADIFDQEQGLILMRRMTRNNEKSRVSLCSPRILSLLRSMVVSKYGLVQITSLAALVNLSLEKSNKVAIVRSGFVPPLIDILMKSTGSSEAQEHAAGALFSLALEDENKLAIGFLGALEPLLHALRSAESQRTRHDAALALYHLSLNQSNRAKLIRLSAVPALLSMVRSGELASRVLLVLCNLAASGEGRAAMLDANAVAILVGKLREGGSWDSEAARENCVAALLALSHGNMRFKGLAREARAIEVLKEVEERGTDRARDKARKMLQIMRERDQDDEDGDEVDWDGVWDSSGLTRTRFRVGVNNGHAPNSSNF